jgi:hypothetical protein
MSKDGRAGRAQEDGENVSGASGNCAGRAAENTAMFPT